MGKFSINYDSLSSAAQQLKNGAAACRRYSDRLDSLSQRRLTSIEGGTTGDVWDAHYQVACKQTQLQDKAERLDRLSGALTGLRDLAKDADRAVASDIESRARSFQSANGMECGFIESAWTWLCDGFRSLLSQTEFGQMLLDTFRNAGSWIADKWRRFREWVEYEGGQFLINIGLGLLAIAAAVVTILTAGTGLLAFFAVAGALIAILNGITKIASNAVAYQNHKENPYVAERMAEISTFSTLLREGAKVTDNEFAADAMNFFAGAVDFVDGVCAVVGLLDSVTTIYENFSGKQTLFQKYLGQGGVFDSIFAKNTPKNALSRIFDPMTMKWYECAPDGSIARGADGLPKVVDFKKAKDLHLSWQAGWDNLHSGALSFGDSAATTTVMDVLKGQMSSDLSRFASNTRTGFSNIFNNLSNTANATGTLVRNREFKVLLQAGADGVKSAYYDFSGLKKIGDFLTDLRKNDVDMTKVVGVVKSAVYLKENTEKFLTGDWWGLGEIGKITKPIDKLFDDKPKEAFQNLRETIGEWVGRAMELGKPAAVPAS